MVSNFEHIRRELSYVRGMMDGQAEPETMEGKVLRRLASVMDDWVEETSHLAARVCELEEYVEAIDEDLDDVEQIAYDSDELDLNMMELECPKCQERVLVGEDVFEDGTISEVLCPECHNVILVNESPATEMKGSNTNTEMDPTEPHH